MATLKLNPSRHICTASDCKREGSRFDSLSERMEYFNSVTFATKHEMVESGEKKSRLSYFFSPKLSIKW